MWCYDVDFSIRNGDAWGNGVWKFGHMRHADEGKGVKMVNNLWTPQWMAPYSVINLVINSVIYSVINSVIYTVVCKLLLIIVKKFQIHSLQFGNFLNFADVRICLQPLPPSAYVRFWQTTPPCSDFFSGWLLHYHDDSLF